MLIQFNTDHNIQAQPELTATLETHLEETMERFASQLTRVEVYLQDTNAEKSGPNDKRCTIEVRASGYDPVVVTHEAAAIGPAFNAALDKVVRTLDRRFGRLRDKKAHTPRAEQPPELNA